MGTGIATLRLALAWKFVVRPRMLKAESNRILDRIKNFPTHARLEKTVPKSSIDSAANS